MSGHYYYNGLPVEPLNLNATIKIPNIAYLIHLLLDKITTNIYINTKHTRKSTSCQVCVSDKWSKWFYHFESDLKTSFFLCIIILVMWTIFSYINTTVVKCYPDKCCPWCASRPTLLKKQLYMSQNKLITSK